MYTIAIHDIRRTSRGVQKTDCKPMVTPQCMMFLMSLPHMWLSAQHKMYVVGELSGMNFTIGLA